MLLSDFFKDTIVDAEFDTLGFGRHHEQNMLTFVNSKKFLKSIHENNSISAILCSPEMADLFDTSIGVAVVDSPQLEFYHLHNKLANDKRYIRKAEPTVIPSSCTIHPLAHIAAHNVKIGEGVTIEEFASVKENTIIGDNCIIRAGSIIGGSGLMAKRDSGSNICVKHCGGVRLGNNVEILQNVSIVASIFPWENTLLSDSVIVADFALVGHGVEIGTQTYIAGGACISGSTSVGERCFIGPSSTVCNRINIGDEAQVTMGAVVMNDVLEGTTVSGNPAVDHQTFLYEYVKKRRMNRNEHGSSEK